MFQASVAYHSDTTGHVTGLVCNMVGPRPQYSTTYNSFQAVTVLDLSKI